MEQDSLPLEPLAAPARLGGSILPPRAHVCAFFSSADDEYNALLPFIRDGLERGEMAFHTVDPARADDHLRRLTAADIDVRGLRARGQLDVRVWNDVHVRGGVFDADAVSLLFGDACLDAERRGFSRTRFVSHMGWSATHLRTPEDLLAYEARANVVTAARPASQVVCVYDLAMFRADLLVDVMRTHPLVLVDGIVHENPFFVSHEALLRELRERARAWTEPREQ